MTRELALVLLCALLAGCSGGAPAAAVPLDQVPEAMLKTSKEKLPDVTFERAVKRADGSYEISGRDKKGKVRDVEFNAAGEVTEVE